MELAHCSGLPLVFRSSKLEVLTKLFLRLKQSQECDAKPPALVSVAHAEPTNLAKFDFIDSTASGSSSEGAINSANNSAQPQFETFKSDVTQSSFVQQTALLFEVTRHKHNTLVFLATSVFLGLFVLTRLYMPTDQLRFGALTPPQLAGEWVLNDIADSPAQPDNNVRLVVAQKNLDLMAKGTDEFGEFDLVGKLIPPNRIHLEKIHNNAQLHDTQIMDGELTLESLPFYAHGSWTRVHAVDPSKENLQTEGYWEANFYPSSDQPKFK